MELEDIYINLNIQIIKILKNKILKPEYLITQKLQLNSLVLK